MQIIEHPDSFKIGTRVLMLKARHKDGLATERGILRVTHSFDIFNSVLAELVNIAQPSERIYGSASARDIRKAMRKFKEMQLAADYDEDVEQFYRTIDARWASALMATTSQSNKMWMFDCDTDDEFVYVSKELEAYYDRPVKPYSYKTKSGTHIIVQPFNKSLINEDAQRLLRDNPLMLWAY